MRALCSRIEVGDTAVGRIADEVGYIPLALRLAASTLQTSGILTPTAYLETMRVTNVIQALDQEAQELGKSAVLVSRTFRLSY